MGEFAKLDPLLHSELRLAVMSTLLTMEEADFVYLREATGATAGNLSVQIDKLSEAGYISVEKGFCGKEAADGVQDYRDGVAGFRCIRRGLEVVSALSADTTSASPFPPIPKPLPRKGLRSLSLRVLIPSTPSEGVKGAYHNGTKLREMLPLRQMDEEAMPFTGPVATVRR